MTFWVGRALASHPTARWKKKGKVFFFEKKKQKTFVWLSRSRNQRTSEAKVFWFFFSKKNAFATPETRDRPR
jgi:hypothetical protein